MINMNASLLPSQGNLGTSLAFLPELTENEYHLAGSQPFRLVSTSSYIRLICAIETVNTLAIPIPTFRMLLDTAALIGNATIDKDRLVDAPIVTARMLARYKAIVSYVGRMVKLSNSFMDMGNPSEQALINLAQKVLADMADQERSSAMSEWQELSRELLSRNPAKVSFFEKSIFQDLAGSLTNFVTEFFYHVYFRNSIFSFSNISDPSLARESARVDLETIIDVMRKESRVASTAEGASVFQGLLNTMSPQVRALFDYTERLQHSTDLRRPEEFATMQEILMMYPEIYSDTEVSEGEEGTIFESSLIISQDVHTSHDISFPDALFITARRLASDESSVISDKGSAMVSGFSFDGISKEAIEYFDRDIRGKMMLATRLRLISDGRRLANLLDTTVPGLLPSDLPVVLADTLGKNVIRLFNCAMIAYKTASEADSFISDLTLRIIDDLKKESFVIGKYPSLTHYSCDNFFSGYLDFIHSAENMLLSTSFNLWQNNPSITSGHKSKAFVDNSIKSL